MSDQSQIAGIQTTGSQNGTTPPKDDTNLNFDFGNIPDANVPAPQEEAPAATVQAEDNLDLNLDLDIPSAPVDITNVNENTKTETPSNEEPAVETQDFASTEQNESQNPPVETEFLSSIDQNQESDSLVLDLPENNVNEPIIETPTSNEDQTEQETPSTTATESEDSSSESKENEIENNYDVETQDLVATEQNEKTADSELVLDLPEVNTEKKDDTRLEESTLDVSKFPTQTPEQVLSQYSETKTQIPEASVVQPAPQNNYFNIDSLQMDGSAPTNTDMPTIAQAMAPQQAIQTETVIQQATPAPTIVPQENTGFSLDSIIWWQTMQTAAMPQMGQPIQTVMPTSNPENILEQQLNKVYQPQQAPLAKSDKFKWVKIFVLAILLLWLWWYIANKMYPIEVQSILSKVGIWWDSIQTNVQSIPDTIDQESSSGTDTNIVENTWAIEDTWTAIVPQDSSATQVLGEATWWDTENSDNSMNYNPFDNNQLSWTDVPWTQWDVKTKLVKIRDDSQWFVELGTRIKNTKIKVIWVTVNKKAISLLQEVESWTNIDSIQFNEEILKLETTLDKLRVIVNEIPTLTWTDAIPTTSWGQIKEIAPWDTIQ